LIAAGARKKNKLYTLMVHKMRHYTGLPGAAGRQRHRFSTREFSMTGKWLELLKELEVIE